MPTKTRAAVDPSAEPELDYDAPDTLLVDRPEQLKALSDELRSHVVALLRERAFSTQQLSLALGVPKGTVGYHLKVLERAGLIRVVRTRKVRAVTEKFYGRTARLFLLQTEDPADARALGSTTLRQAASEFSRAPAGTSFGHPKARLARKDAVRFERKLKKLMEEFLAADTPGGEPSALVGALYRRPDA